MVDRERAAWIAPQDDFSTEGSGADGVDLLAFPMASKPFLVNTAKLEELESATGRSHVAELQTTQRGATVQVDWIPRGYATASGDGGAAPTADVFDLMIANALGEAYAAHGGEGLNAGSGTGNVILDTALANLVAGSLAPVWNDVEARTRWRTIASAAGAPTYTVTPPWAVAPGTGAVLMGCREYGQDAVDGLRTPGAYLTWVMETEGVLSMGVGGKHSAFSISQSAGGIIMCKSTLSFDSWSGPVVRDSRPAHGQQLSAPTATLSPFLWGPNAYAVKTISVEWGVQMQVNDSTETTNGRAGFDITAIDPVVIIEPAYNIGVWHAEKDANTIRSIIAQFGGGAAAGPAPARVNSYAFAAPRMQIESVTEKADGQRVRHEVRLRCLDPLSTGVRRWTLARC